IERIGHSALAAVIVIGVGGGGGVCCPERSGAARQSPDAVVGVVRGAARLIDGVDHVVAEIVRELLSGCWRGRVRHLLQAVQLIVFVGRRAVVRIGLARLVVVGVVRVGGRTA